MQLTVLPSAHGDCLLLESGKKRMLIDGGPDHSFRKLVLPELAKSNDRPIDCVYLSHIDFDHIGGLLVLVDALYAWRVYGYRKEKGDDVGEPAMPRPPEVLKVWHNAFTAQLGDNAALVASALANTAETLSALTATDASTMAIRAYHQDLATHTGHALQLTNRIGAGQLGIKVNPEYKAGLMAFDDEVQQPALKLGKAKFTLLGPTAEDLKNLRREWDDWLRDNKAAVRKIQKASRIDADALTSSADAFVVPLEMEARMLAEELSTPGLDASVEDSLGSSAKELGLRKKVTPPNLASLMFLVEEGKQKLLLTGDGHADDILAGLEKRQKLDGDGKLHVNILKVQHHGAEYNMTPDFARRITADHYVFCGNGYATNPELIVLDTIVEARTAGKFKFWFNSTPEKAAYSEQMTKVQARVEELAAATGGRLKFEFRDDPFRVP
ncbi:MAG TPA: MBL fold metallo-hydrolase [Thermoanaerobaculia bacterium]|nr:MBL fold metallo-hydrolase [Thermoanaerobaculia bacterium]